MPRPARGGRRRRSSAARRGGAARRARARSSCFEGPGPRSRRRGSGASSRDAADRLRCAGSALRQRLPPALLRLHALGYRVLLRACAAAASSSAPSASGTQGRARPALAEDEAPLTAGPGAGRAWPTRTPASTARWPSGSRRSGRSRSTRRASSAPPPPASSCSIAEGAHPHGQPGASPPIAARSERGDAARACRFVRRCCPRSRRQPPDGGAARGTWRAALRAPDAARRRARPPALACRRSAAAPDRRVVVVVEDMTDRIRAERALRGARAPGFLWRPGGGRRARGQHADRRALSRTPRCCCPRRRPGDPALRDPEEDGAPDLPRGAPRQQPPRSSRVPASRTPQRDRPARPSWQRRPSPSETAFAGRRAESRRRPRRRRRSCVIGDPRELEQVFVNLLTNARDASPEGGDRRTCRLERNGRDPCASSSPTAARASRHGRATAVFQPFYTTKKSGRHRPRARHLARDRRAATAATIALTAARWRRRRRRGSTCRSCRAGSPHHESPRRRRRGGHPRRPRARC